MKWRLFRAWLPFLLIMGAMLLVAWLQFTYHHERPAAPETLAPGERAVLATAAHDDSILPVATEAAAVPVLESSLTSGDDAEMARLDKAGRCYWVGAGNEAEILTVDARSDVVEIRFTEGRLAGKAGYVPSRFLLPEVVESPP